MNNEKSQYELLEELSALAREIAERFSTKAPVTKVQEVCNEVWLKQNGCITTFDLDGNDPYDSSVYELMEGIDYVCECTSTEYSMLWTAWCKDSPQKTVNLHNLPPQPRLTWVEERRSYPSPTIGKILDRPVCIRFHRAEIEGLTVLFYECISEMQDYKMVDDWIKKYMPDIPKARTGNFNQIYHAAVEKKRTAA